VAVGVSQLPSKLAVHLFAHRFYPPLCHAWCCGCTVTATSLRPTDPSCFVLCWTKITAALIERVYIVSTRCRSL
jgi:hypothetical protein